MIMLHKRNALVYYYPEDIKSMEYSNDAVGEYKTKLVLRLVGVRETVYVKETPAQILKQMEKKKEKKDDKTKR